MIRRHEQARLYHHNKSENTIFGNTLVCIGVLATDNTTPNDDENCSLMNCLKY